MTARTCTLEHARRPRPHSDYTELAAAALPFQNPLGEGFLHNDRFGRRILVEPDEDAPEVNVVAGDAGLRPAAEAGQSARLAPV